jgi:iron complex transport system substrate-binding protein
MSLNTPTGAAAPRRSVPLTWFVVALVVVAGAAIAATSVYFALRPTTTPGSLTLTDDLGRTVTVPRDPARVAVLSPSIMDTMYRLGLRSHVVAVDCYSAAFGGLSADYSPDQVALWGLSSSMCVQVGPTLEPEQLLNLTPQLVLASTLLSIAEVETISQVDHIPVLMLQPPTLSGVLVDVAQLGEIFGVSTAASSLQDQLKAELGNATAVGANLTAAGAPFPTVLVTYSVDANGYWTFGPGTFGESLIELASASSISANSTLPYPEISGEQVLAANPTYVVYGTGFGLNESSYSSSGPFWSQLGAVRSGHAVGLDSNYLTEPDPTMILVGLPALLALLHPGSGPT